MRDHETSAQKYTGGQCCRLKENTLSRVKGLPVGVLIVPVASIDLYSWYSSQL